MAPLTKFCPHNTCATEVSWVAHKSCWLQRSLLRAFFIVPLIASLNIIHLPHVHLSFSLSLPSFHPSVFSFAGHDENFICHSNHFFSSYKKHYGWYHDAVMVKSLDCVITIFIPWLIIQILQRVIYSCMVYFYKNLFCACIYTIYCIFNMQQAENIICQLLCEIMSSMLPVGVCAYILYLHSPATIKGVVQF